MVAPKLRILIVDDQDNVRLTLSMCLEAEGHEVVAFDNIHDALSEAAASAFDLVFLDIRLGMDDGLDFLPRMRSESPWAKVVVITAYASVSTAVRAMKRGAADYLPKPFTPEQVQLVVEKVVEQRRLEWKIDALNEALGSMDPESDLPTASSSMKKTLEVARQVADSKATILITGEVGTGKGRLARAIHVWSGRANAPMTVAICRTTCPEALEAEVFGASQRDALDAPPILPGKIALSHGGTMLLEEVCQWPPSLEPKLLRFLNDKEYERVNDFRPRPADVRVIATSSVDLLEAVNRRRFRPELRLALEVVRIHIPALRERTEDIRLLARCYLAFFCREYHRHIAGFTSRAMRALSQYAWPGNVRELRNLVDRAALLCKGDYIDVEHFPPNLLNTPHAYVLGDLVSLETINQLHVRQVVSAVGSIKAAADVLGINEKTLRVWLKRYPKEDMETRELGEPLQIGLSGDTHDELAE